MSRRLGLVVLCGVAGGCAGLGGPEAEVHPSYRQRRPTVVAIPPAINRSDELNPETSVTIWQRVRLPGQRRSSSSGENPVLGTLRWCMARELQSRGFRPILVDQDDPGLKNLSQRDRHDPEAVGKAYGADAVCQVVVHRWQSRSLSGPGRVRFHTEYQLIRCQDRVTLWRYSRGSQLVRLSPGVEGSGLAEAIRRDAAKAFTTLP